MALGRVWDPKIHDNFLRKRADKEIYLGINTAINALNDWCPNNSYQILDHKIGLYLGKIVFSKNKQGILAPKFIPSNISNITNEVDKINPLWLDEINTNYVPPQTQFDAMMGGEYTIYNANNVKTLCKNSEANITLSKEQIISYFTQLHQKNTAFIQNYLTSINKNLGIKAYHLNDRLFENLAQKGILPKSMIKRYTDTHKLIRNNALDLTILDYLSTLKETNHKMLFKIVFYDELFYWYFALSLKNFIVNFSASFCDENKLLFNPGAYQQYVHLATQMRQSGEIDPKTGDFKKEFKLRFENQMFETDEYYRELFFSNNGGLMSVDDEYTKLQFISPNQALFERGQPITPSPLGKYYFELSDNKDVYIEFFNRSYPSITNAPKGWSKEMMKKLELGLE